MKRITALLLLSILCFENIAGEKMNEILDVVKNDIWALAEGTYKDSPLIIRYRSKITENLNITKYSQLIKIFWKYSSKASTNGMPSHNENKKMEAFENHIVNALESDLTGILTSVVTNNGTREWVIYTKSTALFSDKLHEMPQETEPYPIKIETEKDINWNYFLNRVRPVE